MKNRRSFLAAVASGGVGIALTTTEPAVAQATPAPSPSASAKPPSDEAAALAAAMRARFDSTLTDADVQRIAKAIDANAEAALALNPKKKRLKNGDAPAVRFAVPGGDE
jgi:hypothetical protein